MVLGWLHLMLCLLPVLDDMESAMRARAVGADAPAYTNEPAEAELEAGAGRATTLATIPVPTQKLYAQVSKCRLSMALQQVSLLKRTMWRHRCS